VVVFDGVMPEVKRRELQRRRDIREKLWRDDQGGGDAGVGAMRRTAKKILVQKLKEWRQKEAKLKGGVIIDMDKRDNLDTVLAGPTQPLLLDSIQTMTTNSLRLLPLNSWSRKAAILWPPMKKM